MSLLGGIKRRPPPSLGSVKIGEGGDGGADDHHHPYDRDHDHEDHDESEVIVLGIVVMMIMISFLGGRGGSEHCSSCDDQEVIYRGAKHTQISF